MENRYGQLPKIVKYIECVNSEMMFYQDMPIKFPDQISCTVEKRLVAYDKIVLHSINDFIGTYGMEEYKNSYVYISCKFLFQKKQEPFNRPGWHTDGFMSNDITYIWSDKNPTIFNNSEFSLSPDHSISIAEMNEQADEKNNITYKENALIKLDQYNIHRLADVTEDGMRAFVKISFSKDKFDLVGNSHNYELDYDWKMKLRNNERNVPQSNVSSI